MPTIRQHGITRYPGHVCPSVPSDLGAYKPSLPHLPSLFFSSERLEESFGPSFIRRLRGFAMFFVMEAIFETRVRGH